MMAPPKSPFGNKWRQLCARLAPHESPASYLARTLGRDGLKELLSGLDDGEVQALAFDHEFFLRREQVPPEQFSTCGIFAGRAFGKSLAGSCWAIRKAKTPSVGALIGPTSADIRDTMIQGPSGILAMSPPWFRPKYEPSKRRLTWPNGSIAICYSADKPDRLRGPNCSWAWGDETAAWAKGLAALDQLPLILRIGTAKHPPQLLLTSTPRPLKKLADYLYADEERTALKPGIVLITGSTLNNAANLAPDFVQSMKALSHTSWGRQEIQGQLLFDVPSSLFAKAHWIHLDVDPVAHAKTLDRIVVSIDPAQTEGVKNDETGIIVAGMRRLKGNLKQVAILEDLSLRGSPREWAKAAINAYTKYGATAIVAEVNTGGDMVRETINTVAKEMGVTVNVTTVRATSAKSARGEPVSALAEAGRIELVGHMPALEKQLQRFTGKNGTHDDRADALIWAVHDLALGRDFVSYIL